jgi:hypothetical protein
MRLFLRHTWALLVGDMEGADRLAAEANARHDARQRQRRIVEVSRREIKRLRKVER